MLTEISVNDMIGLKNISPWQALKELQKCLHRGHLLLFLFYKCDISGKVSDLYRVFRNAENFFHSNKKNS